MKEEMTLALMKEMKSVTFPQCHAGDSIVSTVIRKLIVGEIKEENAEEELIRLVDSSRNAIEKYALSALKIIKDNNLTQETWESIHASALTPIHNAGLFKDQTKLG